MQAKKGNIKKVPGKHALSLFDLEGKGGRSRGFVALRIKSLSLQLTDIQTL